MSVKKSVYDIIKRQNGEAFARAIRDFDSGIFEVPNLPNIVKFAGRDAKPLLNYLESLKNIQIEDCEDFVPENPFKLLKKAGYDAFYADTLEKQNSIQDYYADMEVLCTFKDPHRFKNYYIIHCIKEGADKLNRRDFKGQEQREDAYGTSVISIQILKEGGFISIKNRYNHTVQAPDNTFSSNPNNIIAGLSHALKNYFQVDFSSQPVDLDRDFVVAKGMIYQYHTECQNHYFGDGYYVKGNEVSFINKDYQLIIDNFIVDFRENKVFQPYQTMPNLHPEDAVFLLIKQEVKNGGKLTLKKKGDLSFVYLDDRCILKSRNGGMVYLDLKLEGYLDYPIFAHHRAIEEVHLENVKIVANNSFKNCDNLRKISLPTCDVVFSFSIYHLPKLEYINLDMVTFLGERVLCDIGLVKELSLPLLTRACDACFAGMKQLKKIKAPQITNLNQVVLSQNPCLEEVDLPNLIRLTYCNLCKCPSLKKINLPKLKTVGYRCLSVNKNLQEVYLPQVTSVLDEVLSQNGNLRIVQMPNLKIVGAECFSNNQNLKNLVLNKVEEIGVKSFCSNPNLKFLSLKNVQHIDANCFFGNPNLKRVYLESLQCVENYNLSPILMQLPIKKSGVFQRKGENER